MTTPEMLLTGWLIFCGAGISFAFGILYERDRWSRLIEEGKLPKPGQKWRRA